MQVNKDKAKEDSDYLETSLMCSIRCPCIGPYARMNPFKTCFVVFKICLYHQPLSPFFFKLPSAILPVKVWMRDKGIFVSWPVNCTLCKAPETVDHVFIHCWDAAFF